MGGFVIDEIGGFPIQAVTLDPLGLDQQKVRESGEPIGAFDRTVRGIDKPLEEDCRARSISPAAMCRSAAMPSRRRCPTCSAFVVRSAARSASDAAESGAPRRATAALASSSAAATSSSGSVTARARWRARSSGSVAISARRRWTSRRRLSVARASAAAARRGWAKRIVFAASWMTPAASARVSPGRGSRSIAAAMRSTVGWAAAAANSTVVSASGSSPASRSATSASRLRGTRSTSGSPSGAAPWPIARPSSIA